MRPSCYPVLAKQYHFVYSQTNPTALLLAGDRGSLIQLASFLAQHGGSQRITEIQERLFISSYPLAASLADMFPSPVRLRLLWLNAELETAKSQLHQQNPRRTNEVAGLASTTI